MKKPLNRSKKNEQEKKDLPKRPQQKNASSENIMIQGDILMNLIRDAVIILDAGFHIQHWNKGAEQMYGWKEEEVIGKIAYRVFETDFGRFSPEFTLTELSSKGFHRKEYSHKTKAGTWKDVYISASGILDEQGALSGIILISKDITERKQRETELKYHSALMENIKDAVFSIDNEFLIKSWNKGAEQMYGWTEVEALGKVSYQLLQTDYSPVGTKQAIELFKQNGFFKGTVSQVTKSGEKIVSEMSIAALHDDKGNVTGAVTLNKDITESKQKESELVYHAALMQSIQDAVFSTDNTFTIKSWNKGAEKIYGWTAEEAIGQISYQLLETNYHAYPADLMIRNFKETGSFTGDVMQKTKSGKEISINMRANGIFDEDGDLTGSVVLNRDITENKNNEKRLKELSINLQHQVTLQTKELTNIFERVTDGFVAFDKNWSTTYINKKAGELFGRDPATLIGKHFWSEFPEAVGLPFYEAYQKAMKTLNPAYILEYYQPHKLWYENHIYPSIHGLSIYFRDVTEKKYAEINLEKANRVYQFISSINQMIVRTTDQETLFTEACRIAVEVGKFKLAWIGTLDTKTNEIIPLVSKGEDQGFFEAVKLSSDAKLPGGTGPSARIFQEGITSVSNDIANDPKMVLSKEALKRGFHSAIALPIRRLGKVFANFSLYAGQTDFFDEQEIKLLEEAVNDISFALDFLEKEAMQQRTQDSLMKSERRYQSLTEISPVGVFHTNKEGLVTYVNKKWCSIAGLSFTEALGYGWQKAVFEDDREPLTKSWIHSIQNGTSNQFDFRLQRPDGSIAWVIGQSIPEKDSKNQIIGYVGTITDITERKKAEEKILEVYKETESVLNRINDSMISLDKEWRYTFINDARLASHTHTREEILGKNFWEFNPGLKGTSFEKMYRDAMQTQTAGEVEDYYAPLDVWFHINVYPSPDGLTVLFKDVTEKKRTEVAVKKLNEQLNLSQKIANLGYWEIDLISNNNYWSDEMYRLCEVENDGTVIAPDAFYLRVHPDEKQSVIERLTGLLTNKENFGSIDYRFIKKDGTIRYMLSTGQVIFNDAGTPIRINGTMQDITDRKNIELEIVKEKYLSETVIDNLPGIFYMINQKGKFIRWNRNFEQVMGYDTAEVEKMNRLDLTIETEKEMIARSISESLTSGRESVLTHFVTKAGEIIPFHLTGMAIEYNDEHCLMVMGIDFSERARIQEEMNHTSRQLQALTDHLQTIREEERKRIGRELHDELGQQLTAMKMDIAWINKKTPDDSGLIKDKMKEVINLLDGSNTALRRILNELRPTILDQHGLLDALQWHARQFTSVSNIPLEIKTAEKEIRVRDEIATCIFRVFQESLTNITRYSEAKKVVTFIEISHDSIMIEITDDGKGFDTASEQPKSRQPFGILGMKERVRALHGKFELLSAPGKGTKIHISLPLQ